MRELDRIEESEYQNFIICDRQLGFSITKYKTKTNSRYQPELFNHSLTNAVRKRSESVLSCVYVCDLDTDYPDYLILDGIHHKNYMVR